MLKHFLQRVFINRDYGLLFMGKLVSQLGDGIHYFALTWLVLDLTGSGAVLGTLLLISSLPMIILLPFSGVIADTIDRKILIVSMDVVRGLLMLALAAIYLNGKLTLPVLFAASVVQSLCAVLFNPAISASLPNLVSKDELVQANARDSFSQSATGILGPIAGAFLLGTAGYGGVFLITGISFLLSAVSEMFIRFPKRVKSEIEVQFFSKLKSGFTYLWGHVGLRTLILFALGMNFALNPIYAVAYPYLGKEVLLMDPKLYGFAHSSYPAGLLLGTLLIGFLTRRFAKDKLLSSGVLVVGILAAVLGLLGMPAVYSRLSRVGILIFMVLPNFLTGLFLVQVNVPFKTMMQELVPDHYRGRVFGLVDSTVNMLVPLSTAVVGVLVDAVPIYWLFFISGSAMCIFAVGLACSRSIAELYLPAAAETRQI